MTGVLQEGISIRVSRNTHLKEIKADAETQLTLVSDLREDWQGLQECTYKEQTLSDIIQQVLGDEELFKFFQTWTRESSDVAWWKVNPEHQPRKEVHGKFSRDLKLKDETEHKQETEEWKKKKATWGTPQYGVPETQTAKGFREQVTAKWKESHKKAKKKEEEKKKNVKKTVIEYIQEWAVYEDSQPQSFMLHPAPGDGNCFFHAVAGQLGVSVYLLLQEFKKFVDEHQEYYQQQVDFNGNPSYATIINAITNQNVYAAAETLQAMADFLQVPLHIAFARARDRVFVDLLNPSAMEGHHHPAQATWLGGIYLLNNGASGMDAHYDGLHPVQDEEVEAPLEHFDKGSESDSEDGFNMRRGEKDVASSDLSSLQPAAGQPDELCINVTSYWDAYRKGMLQRKKEVFPGKYEKIDEAADALKEALGKSEKVRQQMLTTMTKQLEKENSKAESNEGRRLGDKREVWRDVNIFQGLSTQIRRCCPNTQEIIIAVYHLTGGKTLLAYNIGFLLRLLVFARTSFVNAFEFMCGQNSKLYFQAQGALWGRTAMGNLIAVLLFTPFLSMADVFRLYQKQSREDSDRAKRYKMFTSAMGFLQAIWFLVNLPIWEAWDERKNMILHLLEQMVAAFEQETDDFNEDTMQRYHLLSRKKKEAEYMKKWREEKKAADPDYAKKYMKKRREEKKATDPDYAKKEAERMRKSREEKNATDPDYSKKYMKKWREEKKATDPDYSKKEAERKRKLRAEQRLRKLRAEQKEQKKKKKKKD